MMQNSSKGLLLIELYQTKCVGNVKIKFKIKLL